MKHTTILGVLVTTAWLALGGIETSPASAQTPPGSQLNVLSTGDQAILLELTVTDFQVEPVVVAGQTYQRLRIPDMVQTDRPGEPQLPVRGALVGLPAAEGVTVEVIDADFDLLSGDYRLNPAPKLEPVEDSLDNLRGGATRGSFTLDQALYASDAFYPGRLIELGQTGYIRDQAVAQVQFYPAQYNPVSGQVRLYRRVVARITWDASRSTAAGDGRGASLAFEGILQNTLLNYQALDRPAISSRAPDTNPTASRAASASGPALKIGVTENGLHELTYSDIGDAGLDLNGLDPRTIKVSNRGVEVPIYVPGEGDGVFDPADTLLFYGTALTDVYTTRNVYWLTSGGSNGQRMSSRDGTPQGATVPVHFPATLHAEEDSYYWLTMPNGQGQDHWFWDFSLKAPETRVYTVTLNNISTTAANATVRLKLKGRTATATNPDHHTRVYLNDVQIDDQFWDGQIIFDHEVTVSHSLLNQGSNTVRLEAVGDTGASVDHFYLNWIELDYWDGYVAENNELDFGPPAAGTYQYEVTGFSSNDVQVFDVTDPASVERITNPTVGADGPGYKLQFQDIAQSETRYLALTSARHKSPASLELDQPSAWKSTAHGADYVIITHQDFYDSIQPLAGNRSASGLRLVTVKVEDLYDEFNHGIFNPSAIRDFLAYTYQNWQPPAPTYVLLVGDAYQDYRDNLNTGSVNYVPTQIIETDLLGETPSDNWFVLVSGQDILPDMLIGRLSAQTSAQVDIMVDKIIRYDLSSPGLAWKRKVLLVADDDSTTFETISDQLAGLLPADHTANKVYVSNYPPGNPTTDITSFINNGTLLVNYTGHGNVDIWGSWSGGRIYRNQNIASLVNDNKLSIVTVANCLSGYFPGIQTSASMAETFLQLQGGGAVAAWAPTGLGYPTGHQALLAEFYSTIFQDGQPGLGAATTAAKIAISGQNSGWDELIETFVLFGDPAMQVGGGSIGNLVHLPLVVKNN
jgi:hypothetical protein